MLQFGGKDSKRHFTVVMGNKEHGLYVSSTPSSAARKAVTKLCTANKSKKVEFHIREITQGSKKKTYGPYSGYIEKLKEPIELKGRVIQYKPIVKLNRKVSKKMKGGMLWNNMYPVERKDSDNFLIATIEYDPPKHNYNSIDFSNGNNPKFLEYLNQEQKDSNLREAINSLETLDNSKSESNTLCYIKQNEDQNNSQKASFNIYVKSFIGHWLKPLLENNSFRASNTIKRLKNLYKRCEESGNCTFNFILRASPSARSNKHNINTRKRFTDLLQKKITGDTHNSIFEPNSDPNSN
jgi:hypothetical protein